MATVATERGAARPTARSAAMDKHSLTIAGHRTSISLERAFWDDLRRIATRRCSSVASLVAEIDAARGTANLCSAIRVYVLAARRGAADGEPQ
jgi:predicted DNA-binding ribbon-helix-helix protein